MRIVRYQSILILAIVGCFLILSCNKEDETVVADTSSKSSSSGNIITDVNSNSSNNDTTSQDSTSNNDSTVNGDFPDCGWYSVTALSIKLDDVDYELPPECDYWATESAMYMGAITSDEDSTVIQIGLSNRGDGTFSNDLTISEFFDVGGGVGWSLQLADAANVYNANDYSGDEQGSVTITELSVEGETVKKIKVTFNNTKVASGSDRVLNLTGSVTLED